MAEFHINPNDLHPIIQSYSAINSTFTLTNFTGSENKKICTFIINGKQCKVEIFIKKNSVTVMPTGKNLLESKLLVDHIASKGYSTQSKTNTVTLKFSKVMLEKLLQHITEDYKDRISYTNNGDQYRFEGFNKDYLTLTVYSTGKAVIQGRPYYVYNAIILFLTDLDCISFEEIVDINNAILNQNTSFTVIRDLIKVKLGLSCQYLEEPLLKSISASLSQQYQTQVLEDYTGCITGVFKALEGYLKKLLTQKFGYKISRNNAFSMFKFEFGRYKIEDNLSIQNKDVEQLINLYKLYKNKRNVFLHATVDPAQTRIIEDKKEAIEISDAILEAIKCSFDIIFGNQI